MNEQINATDVSELLQSIFARSWTASTALGLAIAAKRKEIPEQYADLDEVIELGLKVGRNAAADAWSDAEELAVLLGVPLNKPVSVEIRPVFRGIENNQEVQS